MSAPDFPPLLSGLAVTDDPFDAAIAQAALGCDAGLVVYNLRADALHAAIVFAPEVPLEDAIAMLPACGIGFQNALGALAPPEVAVHLDWQGGIRVNGATCGRLRSKAANSDPAQEVVAAEGDHSNLLKTHIFRRYNQQGTRPARYFRGHHGWLSATIVRLESDRGGNDEAHPCSGPAVCHYRWRL